MKIIEKNSKENEYRDQVLDLLAEYNEEGTPPNSVLKKQ